jgi:hypothetical protein
MTGALAPFSYLFFRVFAALKKLLLLQFCITNAAFARTQNQNYEKLGFIDKSSSSSFQSGEVNRRSLTARFHIDIHFKIRIFL